MRGYIPGLDTVNNNSLEITSIFLIVVSVILLIFITMYLFIIVTKEENQKKIREFWRKWIFRREI